MNYGSDNKLIGAVQNIRMERANLLCSDNEVIEDLRVSLMETAYSIEGVKVRESCYTTEGTLSIKRIFGYGAGGELAAVLEYDTSDSLVCRRVFTHSGTNVEEVIYKDKTSNASRVVHTIDANGKQIGLEQFDIASKLSIKAVIAYNNDKIFEISTFARRANGMIAPWGNGGSVVLSETVKDKMVDASPYPNHLLTSRTVFTYDDSGHVIETANFTFDNSLIGKESYAYDFDYNGNWIKKVVSKWLHECNRFEPITALYRTITYF